MKKRERLDKLISADVLGGAWISVSAGKVVEKLLNLYYPDTLGLLIGWTLAFHLSIVLVLYWKEIEAVVDEYLWSKL